MTAPPTFKNFDITKLRLSANKKQENTIYISNDDGSQVIIYLKCRLAHGIGRYAQKGTTLPPPTAQDSYSFSIDINDDLDYFKKSWNAIENQLKILIEKDSKALLGKIYDEEDIATMWQPKIKKGGIKDEETKERYNSTFSIKHQFDWKTSVSKTQYLDGNNKNALLNITPQNVDKEIPRGSICMMYLRLYKITCGQGKLHVALYPTQVSVNRPTLTQTFAPLGIASDETIGRVRDSEDPLDEDTQASSSKSAFKIDADEIDISDDEDIAKDVMKTATPKTVTKKITEPKSRGRKAVATA